LSDKLFKIADEAVEGGFLLFLGNASATFISALGAIAIARLLGPANYGFYSLSLTIPSLLATLADFGINPALTRYSAKLKAEHKSFQLALILKTGFLIKLIISLLFLLATLMLSKELAILLLNRPEIKPYLMLTSIFILFQAIFSAAYSSLIGLNKMKKVSLMLIAQSIIKAFLSVILILIGLSVLGAILGYLSSYAIAAILGVAFLFLKKELKESFNFSNKEKLENPAAIMIKYGFPAYISVLLATLLTQYQNLILAHFVSNIEIGNFNASINFSALINLIAFPITTVLFPAFSKLNPNLDSDNLKKIFVLAVKYVSLLLIPSSLFVAFLSKEFIFLTYGESYASASFYLSFYMGIFLLTGLGYLVLGNLFNGLGETKITMNMTLITTLVFLPFAPLSVKAFSVIGLIIALIASNLLGAVYGLIQAWKKYQLKIDALSELKIYLASGIAALTLKIASPNSSALITICIKGILYLLAYLTVIAFIEVVKKQELANLSQISNKIKLFNFIAKPILNYEDRLLNLKRRLLKSSS